MKHTTLLGILFFLIALFPVVLYSTYGVVDPFSHGRIAEATLFANAGHTPLQETEFRYASGDGILAITIANVTGLSPAAFQFWIINAIPLILALYVLSKKLFASNILAWIVTCILMFKVGIYFYYLWPHALGLTLFFLFVARYLDIGVAKRWENLVILFIIYLAVHFSSYTTAMWIISFVFFVNLFLIAKGIIWKNTKPLTTIPMLLSFIVIFLGFNRVIYDAYLPKVMMVDLYESIHLFLAQHTNIFLLRHVSLPGEYIWMAPSSPPLLFWANLMWFALIILPVFLFAFVTIGSNLRPSKLKSSISNMSFRSCVMLAIFLIIFVDIVSYGIIGGAIVTFTRWLGIAGIILTTGSLYALLGKVKSARNLGQSFIIPYVCVVLVLTISVFSLNWFYGFLITSPAKYSEAEPSAHWFFNKSVEPAWVVADHHTGGRYRIVAASQGKTFWPRLYDPSSYKHLVDPTYALNKTPFFEGAYVILNNALADKKTTAGGWRDFEPLAGHLKTVENNVNLNKVYNDGTIWVLKGT